MRPVPSPINASPKLTSGGSLEMKCWFFCTIYVVFGVVNHGKRHAEIGTLTETDVEDVFEAETHF